MAALIIPFPKNHHQVHDDKKHGDLGHALPRPVSWVIWVNLGYYNLVPWLPCSKVPELRVAARDLALPWKALVAALA